MIDLSYIAKMIIFVGILITAIGVVFLFADKIPWLGKLPGDIYFQKKNFSLYFPITTCIILSILLSIVLYFLTKR
jgi:uncharacterized protein HemY